MQKRKLFALIALLCLFGIPIVAVAWFRQSFNVEPLTVGTPAPVVSLKTLSGDKQTIGMNNKKTVVAFFTTTCPHCKSELANLQVLSRSYNDGLSFQIVTRSTKESVQEFLNTEKISLSSLLDEGKASEEFRVLTVPALFLIDEQGNLVYRLPVSFPVSVQP